MTNNPLKTKSFAFALKIVNLSRDLNENSKQYAAVLPLELLFVNQNRQKAKRILFTNYPLLLKKQMKPNIGLNY